MSVWYKISVVFVCIAVFQVLAPRGWYEIVLSSDTLNFGALDEVGNIEMSPKQSEVWFFGDIMLARDVEQKMYTLGLTYPFAGLVIPSTTYAVANFESAVPDTHVPTPNNTFRFSTPKQFLPVLRQSGFTHLSLANNHSFDFGLAGYNHTVSALWESSLVPFGHPTVIGSASVSYLETEHGRIAVIGVHTLYGEPEYEVLQSVVEDARMQSDLQVAYVHWGEEYDVIQNEVQRNLATDLASFGVDIIIGHHPHVVQGIEQIGDTLVFYSLGNYIFDQYFSREVQQGLVLKLTLGNTPQITLMPVSSEENRTQPQAFPEATLSDFLTNLSLRSAPELSEQIKGGVLALPPTLATSE